MPRVRRQVPLPEFTAALQALGTEDRERARQLKYVTFRTVQEMRAGNINRSLFALLHRPETLAALAHDGERRQDAGETGLGAGFPEFQASLLALGTHDEERAAQLGDAHFRFSYRSVQELRAQNFNKALLALARRPETLYALAHDAVRLLVAAAAGRLELRYPVPSIVLPDDWMAPGTPEAAIQPEEGTPKLVA